MHKLSPQLALLIIFIIVTPFLLTPHVHANDGSGYYSYVRSWFIDNDANLDNERDHFSQQFTIGAMKVDPTTGVTYSQYPIGTPLLWSPFFIIGHGIAIITNSATDGYSLPYIYLVNLASAIFGFLSLLFSYKIAKKLVKKRTAFLATITFWFSSNLIYYMYFEATMSHAASAFTVTGFIYYWLKIKDTPKKQQWYVLGLLAALMTMVRYQNVLFLIIPIFIAFKTYKTDIITIVKKHLFFIFGFLIGLIPQATMLWYQHAGLSPAAHYQTGFSFIQSITHVLKVLFSTNHGLFLWTPITLLAIIGIIISLKSNYKTITLPLLLAFLFQLFFIASIRDWHGAQSFSHRMFINCSFLFIIGLAFFYQWLENKSSFSIPVIVSIIAAWWNISLLIQYGFRMIPAEGAVSFAQVLSNTIKVIPGKIVSLLKTFLFNRGDLLS